MNSLNYFIYCYFDKYLSKIKCSNETDVGETFINFLTNIIKSLDNKSREYIESKIEEFNENENIKEINDELISIINDLKENFKANAYILGVSESDFVDNAKDDMLPDEISDEFIEMEKINPSYILKYLYICQKEKNNILIPPLSSSTKKLLEYFKSDKILIKYEQKEEENILQQTKLNKEITKHLKNINEKFKKCKIFVDDTQKLIEEIQNIIEFLSIYDVIFIPFIGQVSVGKSTIINSIIGRQILPINSCECTRRGIIIKYWDEEETKMSKAFFKSIKIQDKFYYYFEEIKDVAKGIYNIKQTLEGLNKDFNKKEEDSFFFIRTKIKLFDDLKFNEHYKNMIYLIDLPGFGTGNNFFDINEIYKKTMSISNSFIFVVKNSIIMENENKRMLNDIFESVKEQKRQFSSKFIKSCLFVLNNDDNQKTGEKDIEIAKDEINEILIGIKKEDIKLCFFNAKFYLNYCDNYNYFFNLNDSFKFEYDNFNIYNEKLYEYPGINKKYKSFYEYLYKKIMEKIKTEKICDDKGIPKSQKINDNCVKEINAIVEKEPFIKDNQFKKYQKFIAQELSFAQENINQYEKLKKSNIEEFKKTLLNQIIYSNNEIQKDVKSKIEEIISILDLFFTENREDSNSINSFNSNINSIIKEIDLLLAKSKKEIKTLETTLKKNIKKSLEEKSILLNELLKSQNHKEILEEINIIVMLNISDLKNEIDKYIKLISSKSQDLVNNAKKIFQKFSKIEIKGFGINSFEIYFSENIGEKNKIVANQIYDEIINSTESLKNILLQKGLFDFLQSLFSKYIYLWNIVDMLTKVYLQKINKIMKLIENKFYDYISELKGKIKRRVKLSIRTFTKEQLKIFLDLKEYYEKEKEEINKIKLNLFKTP